MSEGSQFGFYHVKTQTYVEVISQFRASDQAASDYTNSRYDLPPYMGRDEKAFDLAAPALAVPRKVPHLRYNIQLR